MLVKLPNVFFLYLGKSFIKRFGTLQCRAFLCLSNLVTSLEVEEMGGAPNLYAMWCSLGAVAFQGSCLLNGNGALLEAATTSMRAILHRLTRHDAVLHQLKMEDIVLLCQRLTQCNQPESKVIMQWVDSTR